MTMTVVASPGPDFQPEVLEALAAFWDGRDVRHLHHPVWFRQFGDAALAARETDGELAGYMLAHCTPTLAYVHVVAVRPSSRGMGVARELYETIFARAAAEGAATVEAITTPQNQGSVAFHARLGFAAELVPDYAGPGQDRVLLQRALRAR
jgi:ribosomal protein S18 acetylase RimI-like enzyme